LIVGGDFIFHGVFTIFTCPLLCVGYEISFSSFDLFDHMLDAWLVVQNICTVLILCILSCFVESCGKLGGKISEASPSLYRNINLFSCCVM